MGKFMASAVRIYEYGGPEVLKVESIEIRKPADDEILLRQTAIGLNFIDCYHRSGLYTLPQLPAILGMEAAGIIEAIGANVADLEPGDRVAYATERGAYTDLRCLPAQRIVKLPDSISDAQAAAIMLKGLTAHYLIRRTYRVQVGDTVLFHAAAGGVGLIACQWLSHLGAYVIGTAGSDSKAALAKANGCHYVINYQHENIVQRVKEITDGKGVDVVYDSVGKDTFAASLDCLKTRGLFVSYGNASGAIPAFEPLVLSQKGSLFFTRPSLMHYTATAEELQHGAHALFEAFAVGAFNTQIGQYYALENIAQAHCALENRETTGSSIILP